MEGVTQSNRIGMRRGCVIANMTAPRTLDIISEGLPILLRSADELVSATGGMGEHHRSKAILGSVALEELSKIFILMDVVRCPRKIRSQRIGDMMQWFYDHLARLIYTYAQSWNLPNITEIQRCVDLERGSHYIEGEYGEYIMPNGLIWSRESVLYADIMTFEDGKPTWHTPGSPLSLSPLEGWRERNLLQLCHALHGIGSFSRAGLEIVFSVWNEVEFIDGQGQSDRHRLTEEMIANLRDAGLVSPDIHDSDIDRIYESWQFPMYWIDFSKQKIPLEKLRGQQDARFIASVS